MSLLLAAVGIGVLFVALGVVAAALTLLEDGSGREFGAAGPSSEDWGATPAGVLVLNLALAGLIPVTMVALWGGFGWRPRWLASVAGGVRWRWLAWSCSVATLALALPVIGLTVVAEGVSGWVPERQWPALVAVVLVSTPLQAAGEEYLFRGWMPQTIGSLFASPRVGALVGGGAASGLFALAHGQQGPWLFADRFAFGVIASWLVWRTGGLEAGIAVHAVNNIVAFGLTIAQGGLLKSIEVTETGPGEAAVDVVTLLITAGIIAGVAWHRRLQRLFVQPHPSP